jgi:hypothetical protein
MEILRLSNAETGFFLFFGEWLELNLEPGGVGLQSAGLYQVDYLDKT